MSSETIGWDDLDERGRKQALDALAALAAEDDAGLMDKLTAQRRDVLKGLGAAALGGGVVSGFSRQASAGSQSVGTLGTQSNPVDIYGEDLFDPSGNSRAVSDIVSASGGGTGLPIDYSTQYPSYPRQPEFDGPISLTGHPEVSNPVLSVSDVTDGTTPVGVADPFIVWDGGTFYMFLEVLEDTVSNNYIAYATSTDGLDWTYQSKVLDDTQKSFPHVFKHDNDWWMTPTNQQDDEFRIYRATSFPGSWTLDTTPLSFGFNAADPQVFKWDGKWWLLIGDIDSDNLMAYYADTLTGSWSAHSNNPVDTNPDYATPAGRAIVRDGVIDSPRRATLGGQGPSTLLVRITELTSTTYDAVELSTSPVLGPDGDDAGSWNDYAMHHMDAVMPYLGGANNIVAVDGLPASGRDWKIGVYTFGSALSSGSSGSSSLSSSRITRDGAPDQTISSGTWTQVEWPTQGFNTFSSDPFSATGDDFTAPEAGQYHFSVSVQFTNISGSPFRGRARFYDPNGSTIFNVSDNQAAANDSFSIALSDTLDLSSGQTVQIDARQGSGGNIDIGEFSQWSVMKL